LSVKVHGQRIAYLESDFDSGREDARPVVFIHGNSSSARTWLPVMNSDFGRRFRCLAMDLPGHGESEPAPNQTDYSLPGYAAVLTAFAQELEVTDAVFVGWSLGGQLVPPPAHPLGDPRRHPRSFLSLACSIICWRRLQRHQSLR
jgi:pimeloyl-ACP methyl ester carboxylesterase